MVHECALAILRSGDTVVMCHRHPDRRWFPDVWDFPGGHIEDGESSEETLVRELREELGVVIDLPGRPPDEVLAYENVAVRLHVWFIDYTGPIENLSPEKHDDVRWVTSTTARNLDLADDEYIRLIDRAIIG